MSQFDPHPLDDSKNVHPLDAPPAPTEPRSRLVFTFRLPTPVFTIALIAINVLIFAPALFAPELYDQMIRAGMNWSRRVIDGEVYRLFTAMFLHASLPHILFNMLALWSIGQTVERMYGRWRFLAIYLLGGLLGSAFSVMLGVGSSVGASGAVFAIFGAEFVLIYLNRQALGSWAAVQLRSLGMLMLLNLGIGLIPGSNIDNWGHIGGLVGGLALAWLTQPTLLRAHHPDYPDDVILRGITYNQRATLFYAAYVAVLLVTLIVWRAAA